MKKRLFVLLLLTTISGILSAGEKTLYSYKYYRERLSSYGREFLVHDPFLTGKNFTLAMLDLRYDMDESPYGIPRWYLYPENTDKMAGEIVAEIFRDNPAGVTPRAIEAGLLDAIAREKGKLQDAYRTHYVRYIPYGKMPCSLRYVYHAMHAKHFRVIRDFYFYLFRLALSSRT